MHVGVAVVAGSTRQYPALCPWPPDSTNWSLPYVARPVYAWRGLKGRQTIDKVGQFRLPIKSTNKKSVVYHTKIGRICLPLKSFDFIAQLEHVLFSTRKSPNLAYMQSRAAEIRWPVNFKQMYDQQITYLSSNQRRTHMVRCLRCFAVKK